MTKTYCDRCGKQTDKVFLVYHYDRYQASPYVVDAELCEDCAVDYRKFIEGAKVME